MEIFERMITKAGWKRIADLAKSAYKNDDPQISNNAENELDHMLCTDLLKTEIERLEKRLEAAENLDIIHRRVLAHAHLSDGIMHKLQYLFIGVQAFREQAGFGSPSLMRKEE